MKHEFFLDENLASVSSNARLLAAGLPCIADREGRLEDRPTRIKVQLFPYHPETDVDSLLVELHSAGYLTRYETGGQKLIQIENFESDHRPHPKETASTLPAMKGRGKKRQAVKLNAGVPVGMGSGNGEGDLNGDGNRNGVSPPFHGDSFLATLADYEQHRKDIHKTLKDTSRKALYSKLESYGEDGATRALRQSIENGWTGVFPPKHNGRGAEGLDAVREVLNELEH